MGSAILAVLALIACGVAFRGRDARLGAIIVWGPALAAFAGTVILTAAIA